VTNETPEIVVEDTPIKRRFKIDPKTIKTVAATAVITAVVILVVRKPAVTVDVHDSVIALPETPEPDPTV
jgi:hypothetical protein